MASWERFPKAPIVEALLDIRVKLHQSVTLEKLEAFQDGIKEQYPNKRERHSWQHGIEMKPGMEPKIAGPIGGPDGYLFVTADETKIVQSRLDGFTFSWLKPYDKWDSLRDEAKEQWNRYRDLYLPELITRIALRYINRIELPLPIKDFKDYILTLPEVAQGISDSMSGFFMRLVLPHLEPNCQAIVTETIEPPKDNKLPFIFDIDVYREQAFDPKEQDIWEVFSHLRKFKNEIFFESVTERAKELFR